MTPATGLVKNANSTWLIGQPLGRDLEARLGRPIRIMNDADCFALSEATDGAAAGAESVFGVILGTGVGGGIVVRGQCLQGPNLIAGEWGHNPLPWPQSDEFVGPSCYCGKNGCIEAWLSGPGFARDYTTRSGNALSAPDIVAAAAAGDDIASAALEAYVHRLARALASIINVIDPWVIVLGGGMSNIPGLADRVQAQLPAWVFSDRVETRVVRHRHGDSSGVRGAALVVATVRRRVTTIAAAGNWPLAVEWTLAGAAAVGVGAWLLARFLRRVGRRTLWKHRRHIDRYKFTRKSFVIANVLADPMVAEAVRVHATLHGEDDAATWQRVRRYLDEIVPFFNLLAYYRLGDIVSRLILGVFYKVSVEHERPDPFRKLPRDSVVIYLMNHRSNADYVLVTHVLMGAVSISYAVGEWARAFPLEYLFKSFGSYFIRRRYREPLYHAVLQAYVQLITRNQVTQGIFPEGGLTRDGTLRPAKIGLLDYSIGVARDPLVRSRMYVVPIAINYDRVLEDRSLLRELELRADRPVTSRLAQVREVGAFVFWNGARFITGRWRRYGRAAVTIGQPIAVDSWLSALERSGVSLFTLERPARLAELQVFCDDVLTRIGAIIPVTPVPLACAAIQSFDADFIAHAQLVERMAAMRDVLQESNGRVVRADRDIEETFDRAYRMLHLRRMVARTGDGYLVLPRGRPLISYYANSIVHLLGPFTDGVRERDRLPMDDAMRT